MDDPAAVSLTTADGVRLHASRWSGDRADLAFVVLHGFTGSSRGVHVRRICAQLAASGAGVLAPDFRGHGKSGGLSTVGKLEVLDVAAAVAHLRADGYHSVAVIGWSMGGSAALRYAGLGGDVDAVASVSSPGAWFERGTRAMRIVHWLCEKRTGRLVCRVVRHTRLAPESWDDVPESPEEVVGAIAPTPLLIVHGDADHYFPLRHVDLLAAAAPTAELWIEPGMGHAETATTPELVERIAAWVRSVVAPEAVCDDGRRD
ncbi:MAG TPA: alpha/beta fold hydrolase [Jatrophihabitantaceae bacterium]|nr:alpha/beta fold hydrolase [Jatrophihabitantaceae bacterium]